MGIEQQKDAPTERRPVTLHSRPTFCDEMVSAISLPVVPRMRPSCRKHSAVPSKLHLSSLLQNLCEDKIPDLLSFGLFERARASWEIYACCFLWLCPSRPLTSHTAFRNATPASNCSTSIIPHGKCAGCPGFSQHYTGECPCRCRLQES